MSFATYLESLKDFCVECDDVFTTEAGTEPTDRHQLGSCLHLGHSRVLNDSDIIWKICERCHGDGVLQGFAGTYTMSDFWTGDVDLDDYLEHRRSCEDCGGTGKKRDLRLCAYDRPAVQQALNEFYDDEAMSRQEREMGA